MSEKNIIEFESVKNYFSFTRSRRDIADIKLVTSFKKLIHALNNHNYADSFNKITSSKKLRGTCVNFIKSTQKNDKIVFMVLLLVRYSVYRHNRMISKNEVKKHDEDFFNFLKFFVNYGSSNQQNDQKVNVFESYKSYGDIQSNYNFEELITDEIMKLIGQLPARPDTFIQNVNTKTFFSHICRISRINKQDILVKLEQANSEIQEIHVQYRN